MQIASWVLVTSTLVAPSARPATTDTGVRADEGRPAVTFAAAQQRPTIGARPTTSAPTYRFGLGGAITVSNYGIGGSARYWFNKHIGMSLISTFRPGREYASYSPIGGTSTFRTSSTLTASPSFMVMLNETDPNREVSFRPYMGVGAGYIHASRSTGQIVSTSPASPVSYSAMTEHAYGGAEMFFRDYPSLALSGELIYYNIPNRFVNRQYVDGLNFQVSAHFYLK